MNHQLFSPLLPLAFFLKEVEAEMRRIVTLVSIPCCPPVAGDTPRPKSWGGVCNQGSHQSPIDIPLRSATSAPRAAACPSTGALTFDYGLVKGSVINTGHALEVRYSRLFHHDGAL